MEQTPPLVTDSPERLYVAGDAATITPSDDNPLAAVKATYSEEDGIGYIARTAGVDGNSITVSIDEGEANGVVVTPPDIAVTIASAGVDSYVDVANDADTITYTSTATGEGGNGTIIKIVKPDSTANQALSVTVDVPSRVLTVNLEVDGGTDVLANFTTALAGSNNDLAYTSKLAGPIGNTITVRYVAATVARSTTTAAITGNRAITVALAATAATATLTTALTGTNNDLVFTSTRTGSALGNQTEIEYVDPGENDAELSILISGDTIQFNLATDSGGLITSTADDLKAALLADSVASALVTAADAAANDGSGVVTALAATALAGGGVLTITSTAAQVKAAIEADYESNALVTVANAAANDGTGAVIATSFTLANGKYADAVSTSQEVIDAVNDLVANTIVQASLSAGSGTDIVVPGVYTTAGGRSQGGITKGQVVGLINSDVDAKDLVYAFVDEKHSGDEIELPYAIGLADGADGQWALEQGFARAFRVGESGDVSYKTFNGSDVVETFFAGDVANVAIIGINSTDTTITDIVGYA